MNQPFIFQGVTQQNFKVFCTLELVKPCKWCDFVVQMFWGETTRRNGSNWLWGEVQNGDNSQLARSVKEAFVNQRAMEKNCFLGLMGDYTTQLCGDYNKPFGFLIRFHFPLLMGQARHPADDDRFWHLNENGTWPQKEEGYYWWKNDGRNPAPVDR